MDRGGLAQLFFGAFELINFILELLECVDFLTKQIAHFLYLDDKW